MRAAGIPIHFDLTGLTIEVFPKDDKRQVQPLPLWSGFSYHSEHGYGRIISAGVKIQMGVSSS
jgi:hypothetical protein